MCASLTIICSYAANQVSSEENKLYLSKAAGVSLLLHFQNACCQRKFQAIDCTTDLLVINWLVGPCTWALSAVIDCLISFPHIFFMQTGNCLIYIFKQEMNFARLCWEMLHFLWYSLQFSFSIYETRDPLFKTKWSIEGVNVKMLFKFMAFKVLLICLRNEDPYNGSAESASVDLFQDLRYWCKFTSNNSALPINTSMTAKMTLPGRTWEHQWKGESIPYGFLPHSLALTVPHQTLFSLCAAKDHPQ